MKTVKVLLAIMLAVLAVSFGSLIWYRPGFDDTKVVDMPHKHVYTKNDTLYIEGTPYSHFLPDRHYNGEIHILFKKLVSHDEAISLLRSYGIKFQQEPGYAFHKKIYDNGPEFTAVVDKTWALQWAEALTDDDSIEHATALFTKNETLTYMRHTAQKTRED